MPKRIFQVKWGGQEAAVDLPVDKDIEESIRKGEQDLGRVHKQKKPVGLLFVAAEIVQGQETGSEIDTKDPKKRT